MGAIAAGVALLALLALGGCAAGKPGPTPTPTKTRMPTFTPVKATATAPVLAVATSTPRARAEAPPPTVAPPTAEPTLPPVARLTVSRRRPICAAARVPTMAAWARPTRADTFEVTGKNAAGDWWQINANGGPAWVAASVVSVENPQLVALAQDIPAPPVVAVAPPAPTRAPAAPAPAPPPAADACAGIGGDGCKWKVVAGPQTADNGGQEIKLQLLFIHSGSQRQPQGSYFVVLIKDGQRLPVSDSVRSTARVANDGSLGKYNYEYTIGAGDLPGQKVAGNYTLWVLDGNGERDSHNLNFSISGNQGLLWIKFDQA